MDFTKNVDEFNSRGTYNYQFDEVGNLLLNPSSSVFEQQYFSIPLMRSKYNDAKINSFYDTNFTEFIKSPTTGSDSEETIALKDELNRIEKENAEFKKQLDVIIAKDEQGSVEAQRDAIRNIILELRIKLKQGETLDDFEVDFPYFPNASQENNLI